MSRTKNVLVNSVVNIFSYSILMILGFVLRKVFLLTLSIEYLGVEGLFSNVLAFLDLAELGIGSAISYRLFETVAKEDIYETQKIMCVFRRLYIYIASFLCAVGVLGCWFVPLMAQGTTLPFLYLRIVFLIQVFKTASSYFFSYKRMLLLAKQKKYVCSFIDMVTRIFTTTLQIFLLFYTKSYIIYLLGSITTNFIANIATSIYCHKKYPEESKNIVYNSEMISEMGLTKDIKGTFLYRIGVFIFGSTDNIIISAVLGVITVGYYANYMILVQNVIALIETIFASIQGSLGNLLALSTDREQTFKTLRVVDFICFLLATSCSIAYLSLVQPFTSAWLGEIFILPNAIPLLLGIHLFITFLTKGLCLVHDLKGLFVPNWWGSILSAAINLILSLWLVHDFGVAGVILGTICGGVSFVFVRLYYVNQYFGGGIAANYLFRCLKYTVIATAEIAVSFWFVERFIPAGTISAIVLRTLYCAIVPVVVNIAMFIRSPEMQFVLVHIQALFTKGRRH